VHVSLPSFDVVVMAGPHLAVRAAEKCRPLRQRGVTVRKTIGPLIAPHCIENGHTLLFSDRDLPPYVEHLGLEAVSRMAAIEGGTGSVSALIP
jgi:hypothetical protein